MKSCPMNATGISDRRSLSVTTMASLVSQLLLLLCATPRYSSFAPVILFDGSSFFSSRRHRVDRHRCYDDDDVGRGTRSFLPSPSFAATTVVEGGSFESKSSSDDDNDARREFSYAAMLKAVDESHYDEAERSCPYLDSELLYDATAQPRGTGDETMRGGSPRAAGYGSPYSFPAAPVLSDDAVRGLRWAARSYFMERAADGGGGDVNHVGSIDRVSLGDLLVMDGGGGGTTDPKWKESLDVAMMHIVYPSVRSGWPNHDAFSLPKYPTPDDRHDASRGHPVLTVTSASVFAAGGVPGAKAAMTTFERDPGLFVVHIDLGNDDDNRIEDDADNSSVMGALYMESLVDGECEMNSKLPIVGPLLPGQMVVHQSMQRTAAITVPSNVHDLKGGGRSTVDCSSRTHILKAAERTRHYALRLILTTMNCNGIDVIDGVRKVNTPPAEERSYRLRNYARFCRGEDRVRYLTLAGLLDLDDYENHLWLGFDYIARIDNPDYRCDLHQRLSDVNRAVFHLEKSAALCPTDSRIHFQLATAIGAKVDCEERLMLEGSDDQYHVTRSNITRDLTRMAQALERSAELESAAVKLGVNGIEDLAICLNALASTRCKLGEFDKALAALDRWAECGSIRSILASEDASVDMRKTPSYDWIQATDKKDGQKRNVAVKTVGDVPVFEPEDIALLRAAADKRFALAAGTQTSRYTMQYEGNSEVHLDDLCAGDPVLKSRMDRVLQEKVYPLVRSAFAEAKGADDDEPPLGPLCVYDSIFVRYNGDKAKAAGRRGASQPLHQDGGIYSVNIALNNAREEGNEHGFSGGGTFFEALTVGDGENIQLPSAPGHAIIHKTTQRHAGAPTTSGVRDILVIFLTARRAVISDNNENTWRIERAMRLQSIGKELDRDKLILSLRLARENDPTNSEVPYWHGVHLIQGDMNEESDDRWTEITQGVESLKLSTLLNPADARAHYHLGMAISARHKYAMRTKRAHLLPPAKEAGESVIDALETAIRLERKCTEAGCENGINISAAYLALGDFMARLKSYDRAITYLNQVEGIIGETGDMDKRWAQSMLEEVLSLTEYCKREAANKMEPSLVR
ncbi:hypothetical protein ACHAXA_004089 [Cyclostephanos tholiformis]|uniref:Fe2OG dioxygenase domain-containing protein n=1 Tax=Cyclostephanos tholiformis TaxID=382380 RepID=A0ABD3R3G1_9STRA